ncbi:MAG: endonuclease NucS domain-containing protein [Patescibacteria group bacterium]
MNQDIIQKIISEKSYNPWWLESEKKVVGKYGQMFNPTNLDRLTKEDFKSFLLIKNNLHWEGIHRQSNLVTSDMEALKRCLRNLLDEKISIRERLGQVFNVKEHGRYVIKGLGKAVITPILLVVYPTKYGVWNTRSETALKKLDLFPKFLPRDSFADKYLRVNDVILELVQKYNITLWQLDGIFGEISGSSPFGSTQSEEEIVEEEVQEHGVVDLANFGMESHLEDFLISNWDKTIFGNKYELIYDEGDLTSQQYRTSVGEIDILAKEKNGEEFLVIELKKGRTSDAVVGQILRYIAWIKENMANGKTVKGAVVVLDVDEKLKYALKELKDIKLYTYKVNFKLTPQDI